MLHRGRTRIAEDRAVAERARAELHAALEPADDLVLGQAPSPSGRQRLGSSSSRTSRRSLSSRRSISACVKSRAEIGAVHAVAALFTACACVCSMQMIGRERRAERAAGVARRGLNPDVARKPSREGSCRWRRNSARRRPRGRGFACRFPRERARQPQHDFFGDRLDRSREIHVALRQQLLRLARRAAEQLVERRVGHRQAGAVIEIVAGPAGTSRRPSDRSDCRGSVARSSARRTARAPSPCIRRS